MGETERALEFLKSRFDRYSNQSPGPAISLYNALYSIDREAEGIRILEEAVSGNSDDAQLLLFIARQYLVLGDADKCSFWLDKAEGFGR